MSLINNENYILKNGLNIIIRNAETKDAVSLIDINLKIIDEKLYMLRSPGEAVYDIENEKENIKRYLNNDGTLYIVAETGDKITGYLEFESGRLKRTKHAGSLSLYILNEYRGMGIGELLMKTLIEWAEKEPAIEKVTLAVFSTNEKAQALYKKLGFLEEGRCPKDMKLEDGTYMDSVLMYRFV